MTLADAPFRAGDCPRCGEQTLTGRADGLLWRLDATPVHVDHALLLKRYGVSVVLLSARTTGVWGDTWHPAGHELTPHRYLAVPHVCGSAHSQREATR